MNTSFVLAALTGLVATSVATAEASTWATDYAVAYTQGQKEKKPLAVVFGSGQAGAEALVKEGKLDKEVLDAMKTGYISVYVDVDQDAGRKLAESFKVTGSPALVLTDRDVDYVALRQIGTVAKADLVKELKKYAEPGREVVTTETNVTTEIRYYPPAASAPVTTSVLPASAPTVGLPAISGSYVPAYAPVATPAYAPSYAPAFGSSYAPAYAPSYAPAYAPSYAPAFAPSFGGGCPNGRCPNR